MTFALSAVELALRKVSIEVNEVMDLLSTHSVKRVGAHKLNVSFKKSACETKLYDEI